MQSKLLIVLRIILNRWGVYMKKLIVACGSGVATSTTIAEKIKSRLESKNVNYKSIMSELPGADIYVYIAKPDDEVLSEAERLNIAVFPGVPFLTGMGADDVFDKICEAIAK